jgi:hypothetical protein
MDGHLIMSESKHPPDSWKKTLFLGLGMVSAVGVIIGLHFISPRLPGTAGTVFKNNMEHSINAEALFYTEVGDVSEFLNQKKGKYGIDLSMSTSEAAKKP